MYPCYRDGILVGRESFPWPWILGENLLYLASWILAGWLLWPVQVAGWTLATLGWAVFVITLQVLLKQHNCAGCYYYGKSCHLGWGRLAASPFRQDAGNPEVGMTLAVPMYMLSPPLVVAAAVVIGLCWPSGTIHWVALGGFVALNAISFLLRSTICGHCKMRAVCPGSAHEAKPGGDGE